MACLRRVLPLWERAFPGDDRVQEMLNLTQGLIDASQDPDDAEMTSDEFLADVYDEIEDFDAVTQPAALVGNGVGVLQWLPVQCPGCGAGAALGATTSCCRTPSRPATAAPAPQPGHRTGSRRRAPAVRREPPQPQRAPHPYRSSGSSR